MGGVFGSSGDLCSLSVTPVVSFPFLLTVPVLSDLQH